MTTETDYRAMFDRNYIGSWDLDGRDVTLTIARVKGETLTSQGAKKSKRPVIFFVGPNGKEHPKAMVLNKTNGLTIAKMYGTDTTKWVGKRITIWPTTTLFGRETVDCIRVRPGIPRGKDSPIPDRAPEPTREAEPEAEAAPVREPGED